ncbi:YdcF family protein [Pseudoclavibacter helvolus]|uniref:YdcF family protein n=1 Tax=Pseudoclavibacter helvolus TaxID=255205 RepID=UPI0024AD70C2|nr:YdcF family protein [Pseudoclavibacter helvolus]
MSRKVVWWFVGTGLGLLAVFVASIPLYVLPPVDEVDHVDAVVVLGPAKSDRIEEAREMLRDGRADQLVISIATEDLPGPNRDRFPACDSGEAICFTPAPFTTLGEARAVDQLAAENGWESVAVVTVTPHVSRARWYFDHYAQVEPQFVGVSGELDFAGWARQYAYQSMAWVKALIDK